MAGRVLQRSRRVRRVALRWRLGVWAERKVEIRVVAYSTSSATSAGEGGMSWERRRRGGAGVLLVLVVVVAAVEVVVRAWDGEEGDCSSLSWLLLEWL